MRNSKSNGKEPEKNRRGKLSEKSSSFHGRIQTIAPPELRRPKTLPDLLTERAANSISSSDVRPNLKLTKLLLNVTIQGSLGAVQVIMSPENTVGDLITAAVMQHSKEGRRQILLPTDVSLFDLHYSQFSLERLGRGEKLITLGSRNFFLCTKTVAWEDCQSKTTSCTNEVENVSKSFKPWFKIMDLF